MKSVTSGAVASGIAARGPDRRRGPSPRRGPRRQRGMGMTGIMTIMAVAIFLGLFAIKAGPAFFENMTVKSVVGAVAANETLMSGSRSKVYQQINAQYNFNNLWDLRAEDTVELKKSKRGYDVRVNYEKRETLFGNIDLVMRFDDMMGEEAGPK